MIVKQVRDRIGFKEVKFEELPNNRCEALVDLAWPEGDVFIGTAQGKDSEAGRLKCAAEATTRALEQSVNDQIELEVQGVQTITVSDTTILIWDILGFWRPFWTVNEARSGCDSPFFSNPW